MFGLRVNVQLKRQNGIQSSKQSDSFFEVIFSIYNSKWNYCKRNQWQFRRKFLKSFNDSAYFENVLFTVSQIHVCCTIQETPTSVKKFRLLICVESKFSTFTELNHNFHIDLKFTYIKLTSNFKIHFLLLSLLMQNKISPHKKKIAIPYLSFVRLFVRCLFTELYLKSGIRLMVSIVTMLSIEMLWVYMYWCSWHQLEHTLTPSSYRHTIGNTTSSGNFQVCVLSICITDELSEAECAFSLHRPA